MHSFKCVHDPFYPAVKSTFPKIGLWYYCVHVCPPMTSEPIVAFL